jgi:hypothetical protein
MAGFDRLVVDDAHGFLNGRQHALRAAAIVKFVFERFLLGTAAECAFRFAVHGPPLYISKH